MLGWSRKAPTSLGDLDFALSIGPSGNADEGNASWEEGMRLAIQDTSGDWYLSNWASNGKIPLGETDPPLTGTSSGIHLISLSGETSATRLLRPPWLRLVWLYSMPGPRLLRHSPVRAVVWVLLTGPCIGRIRRHHCHSNAIEWLSSRFDSIRHSGTRIGTGLMYRWHLRSWAQATACVMRTL